MKLIQTEETLGIAAAKAGMDEKTARKYRDAEQLLPNSMLQSPVSSRRRIAGRTMWEARDGICFVDAHFTLSIGSMVTFCRFSRLLMVAGVLMTGTRDRRFESRHTRPGHSRLPLISNPGRCPPDPRRMVSGLQHRTTTQRQRMRTSSTVGSDSPSTASCRLTPRPDLIVDDHVAPPSQLRR